MAGMPRIASLALPLLVGLAHATELSAQTYPSRSVRIIVPFSPGGPTDVYGRILAQKLGEALKRAFIMENRPGAGTMVGTDVAAKAAPDGYTLVMVSSTHATNESLAPNKPYQLMRDFVAVAPMVSTGPGHGRAPIGAGEGRAGAHRARQSEARFPQLCFVGIGFELSYGGRAV
jgi:tripartite-type tricarboxylate transporter receptor subunit TctC